MPIRKIPPIKVLYLSQFAQIGGGETSLLYLISKLDKRKFEAHIILPQKGQFYNRLKKLKAKIYIIKLPPYLIRSFFVPGLSPFALKKLFKLTKKIQPDLIHVNHLTFLLYAGVVAKVLKIPTVGTAHGVWDSFYFYQDLATSLFADNILANTPHTANFLLRRKIVKPNKVKIIPFGIDTSYFKPAAGHQKLAARKALSLPQTSFIVTIVGRLDPQKDHLTFLKTAKIVNERLPNSTFFIVGSKLGNFSGSPGQKNSYLEEIKDFLTKNPKLAAKVIFGGFIEDMPKVYWASDIVVSTSSSAAESFGLALVEAASCAIPIVSTKTASQQLIVQDGKTGFLVLPKRPDLLAQKILYLAKNPNIRKKFGQNARTHIQNNFHLKKYYLQVESLYQDMLGDLKK